MAAVSLAGWENFYVLAGSAAGGLTGLTFVVIALAADAHSVRLSGLRTFVTPTIVHFGSVLALAAYLSVPGQNTLSLSLGFTMVGLGGVIYVGTVGAGIARITGAYVPVAEDWIWNAILPGIVYAGLLAGGLLIWRSVEFSLYMAAAVSVLLMIVGIHNAWDIAVWNTLRGKRDVPPPS
jgi:hypothetical protein